ncbi:murein transglycosylase A [Uliginosibacterium aquaticum]|uniref:peptidoglycan lytic exotransglycosylase n=1 Tax=Uliginosibacterium aquaticum TaxID=2731212 RepID=A0ABX2IAV0_9RHOO|nr:MltA domain-containing protein [Uliginosibacterium aquaticum]NSL53479.1 MltA domain-containing protein [Uliginosibacterium aquaticum]
MKHAWILAGLLIAGCASQSVPLEPASGESCPVCPVCPEPEKKPEPPVSQSAPAAPAFREAAWSELPDWSRDKLDEAWPGLLASCRAIRQAEVKAAWAATCEAAKTLGDKPASAQVRAFLEERLQPLQIQNADGSQEGLITGYYEPLIQGSRWKSAKNPVPVHALPDDLLQLDLGEVYPETKSLRLRGRIEGRKVVPYWSRAQIEAAGEAFPAKVLLWAHDPVEFFFLQVQGSGQVQLADGSRVRIAYADQNGHPYKSIGRWLIDRGELTLAQASAQGIQKWARENPQRLSELLNANPSYVFFREEAANGEGPKGSLGVPLTGGRAIAVDTRTVPLGAPVFLSFAMPDGKPVRRLMLAQDTGGAIRGRVRADFFWGFGAEAGAQAGKMRQQGKMWLLWPKGAALPMAQ